MSDFEHRLCRLAQEAADADDPLIALETLVELRGELEACTRERVGRALRGGRSFADVARAVGISRQAAHRRYRDLPAAQAEHVAEVKQRPRVAATEETRRVVWLAREEALSTRAAALRSEHVLIGVLRSGGEVAQALIREGATLESVRACERAMATDRPRPSSADPVQAELRGLLQEATRSAIVRGERWLDARALLLAALADPRGGARRILASLGVDAAAVRGRLRSGRPYPPAPSSPAVDPRRRDVA